MSDDSDPSGGPTDSEVACFEAGIKFGSLYHQFAGTPVSPDSAASLGAAMAEAIENQPHCTEVTVDIDEERLREAIADGPAAYTELTGRFLDVAITVTYGDVEVLAVLEMEDGYPLMSVESIRGSTA